MTGGRRPTLDRQRDSPAGLLAMLVNMPGW